MDDEKTDLLRWVWSKITPTAPYCDILEEDRKNYEKLVDIFKKGEVRFPTTQEMMAQDIKILGTKHQPCGPQN